ncbi:putative reverse transcriptase domain-containing protein [Tanacetum coccineum]
MQEELLQFKIQKVWTLVDLPSGKKAIGTKWVYRNNKDERGIVVRNKARLVAQGYKQEEDIDYDEVFPPIARVEAIRLFLAFASFMNVPVYQMDVKSTFLYDTIEEEDPYVEAALQAPPSPDYVSGPEEPEQAPPSPDYVPGPEHADDEIVAEDQPYAEDASPTVQSPDYVPESDPEVDPEEDDDEDPEEDPVDYPADRGDDGDDEDEPSEEDEDDDVDIEADEDEEEEEHPAPADSVVVALPTTDQATSAKETEPFETDESAATPPPHPAISSLVAILLAISTPPSSHSSMVSPLPQIPSPPLPPIPSPSLHYQPPITSEAASTSHSLPLPPPFILSPTSSPSLGIPTLATYQFLLLHHIATTSVVVWRTDEVRIY